MKRKENICALCACNGSSHLGQGELIKIDYSLDFDPKILISQFQNIKSDSFNILLQYDSSQQKYKQITKIKTNLLNELKYKLQTTDLIAYDLTQIGWKLDNLKLSYIFKDGNFYLHESCLMWSNGIVLNEFNLVINSDRIACESLLKVLKIVNLKKIKK